MGKNFCKVANKWCKYLKHSQCEKAGCLLREIKKCPRLEEIETVRFYDLLRQVKFEDAYAKLVEWWPDQDNSDKAYRSVYDYLLTLKPKPHNLNDLYIEINLVEEDDSKYLDVNGVRPQSPEYGFAIEFKPWVDWVSMFVTQKTLDTFDKETIVGACMYEMTFVGFTDCAVQEKYVQIFNDVEEARRQLENNDR